MPEQQFDIFFDGQIMDGHDLSEVKTRVGKLFKVEGPKLERLFSGTATCVKKGVDAATASKYRKAFRDAGALIEIKPTATTTESTQPTEEAPEAPEAPEAQDDAGMTLLPANTGSLIDCAKEVIPQPIPHTVELELSSAGAIMDESAPPPPAEIDTSELSISPANSGSLEEFQQKLDPAEIPDISALDLDQVEE